MSRIQFHILAISVIVLVVSSIYALGVGQEPLTADQLALAGGKIIAIESATWGQQCNPQITEAIKERASRPVSKTGATEPLKLVEQNNVLEAVGKACNGKVSCDLRASASELGFDPLGSCYKRLVVRYRCFQFDRLTTLDINQGERLSINCLQAK